jgi:two-component system cell cycle sensor histidine kinase/response regulator CckA
MILPRRGRRLIERLLDTADPAVSLLFDDPATGRLIADPAGQVLRANANLAARLGRSAEGLAVAGLFRPADRPAIEAALAAVLRGDRLAAPIRAHLVDAGEQAVAVSVTPLREADGGISGLLLRLADLDAELRLETRLAQSQKLQAVGQLAGGIAHDFNNLLTAIIGATDAMLAQTTADAETVADLRQVRVAAERGAALVRQLLAFGRRQPLQPRVVAANRTIQDLASLLQRLLGEKVRLDLTLEEPGRLIRVDPTQLDQVLINLALNARAAMPDGGALTLRTGHRTLYRAETLGAETVPAGRYVLIEVEDTGTGIPPEVMPRIFEPFFTTRRDAGGTGLGLPTVLGIIRQSGGFLTIDSAVGRGTTVGLYLPRHEGPAPAEAAPPPAAPATVAPGHLLLVEDDNTVRRFAERGLRRAGWRVTTADSGEAALDSLPDRDQPVDLLVSDIVMPGMEGPALLVALRKIRPDLPAVFVSGYAESALKGDLPTERVVFLPKPYSMAELLAAMAEVRK